MKTAIVADGRRLQQRSIIGARLNRRNVRHQRKQRKRIGGSQRRRRISQQRIFVAIASMAVPA